METLYGIPVDSFDNKYATIAEAAIEGLVECGIPGSFLVDLFPILKHVPSWVPGASFQTKALKWRKAASRLLEVPINSVKSSMRTGTFKPSVASTLLTNSDGTEEYETTVANAAAIAYVGGADTTTSSVAALFMAMALYPEVQRRAQAELDSVTSLKRLPDFSDMPNLPYIGALVKELLRWQPVTPLAVVHRAIEDDEYRGYHIPRGAMVLGNAWAILHDEKHYPDPDTFSPERFLKEDGELNPEILDPTRAAFGFGRRICPGRHMAVNNVFIAVASILSAFSIEQAVDDHGKPIPIEVKMSPGLVSYPEAFPCAIKPRLANIQDIIIQQATDANA